MFLSPASPPAAIPPPLLRSFASRSLPLLVRSLRRTDSCLARTVGWPRQYHPTDAAKAHCLSLLIDPFLLPRHADCRNPPSGHRGVVNLSSFRKQSPNIGRRSGPCCSSRAYYFEELLCSIGCYLFPARNTAEYRAIVERFRWVFRISCPVRHGIPTVYRGNLPEYLDTVIWHVLRPSQAKVCR